MLRKFEKISKIDPLNNKTWENKIFLTFDMDWVNDEVLEDVLILLEKSNIESTWFVTHKTKYTDVMKKNKLIELGIHPNFNDLLKNDAKSDPNNVDEVLKYYSELVPNAKIFRNHSLFQSNFLLNIFKEKGFTIESNVFLPSRLNLDLKPWYHWNGLIRVPICWEDDIFMYYNSTKFKEDTPKKILNNKKFIVFNFHPIHIYINTFSEQHYSNAKKYLDDPKTLLKQRYDGYGIRNYFKDLIFSTKSYQN